MSAPLPIPDIARWRVAGQLPAKTAINRIKGTRKFKLGHLAQDSRISVGVHDALNLVTTSPAGEYLSFVAEIVIRVRTSR
jgi:hypothetical protein